MIELFAVPVLAGLVIAFVWGKRTLEKDIYNEKVCKEHYEEQL